MQFTINRQLFVEKLDIVMRAVSSRTPIPILTGIKLELSAKELVLTGSDSNFTIKLTIPVNKELKVISTGAIVLPARLFSEIVKKLPGATFSFEVKEAFQTFITSESTEFMINGLDSNTYPRLPEISTESTFKLSGQTLAAIINQTVFAVSNQESRPALSGVNFDFSATEIKAVATDAHRLARRKIALKKGPKTKTNLIIPGDTLVELAHIIGDSNPEITVAASKIIVHFTIGQIDFYSRILEGTYPDTDRLIPTESTTQVEFTVATLARALDRASLLTHESANNVVKLELNVTNQKAIIRGESMDMGNVEEAIPFEKLTGADLEIAFNPDYMRDALRAAITEKISINFTKALSPFTLLPDKKELDFVQLITPVRTFN